MKAMKIAVNGKSLETIARDLKELERIGCKFVHYPLEIDSDLSIADYSLEFVQQVANFSSVLTLLKQRKSRLYFILQAVSAPGANVGIHEETKIYRDGKTFSAWLELWSDAVKYVEKLAENEMVFAYQLTTDIYVRDKAIWYDRSYQACKRIRALSSKPIFIAVTDYRKVSKLTPILLDDVFLSCRLSEPDQIVAKAAGNGGMGYKILINKLRENASAFANKYIKEINSNNAIVTVSCSTNNLAGDVNLYFKGVLGALQEAGLSWCVEEFRGAEALDYEEAGAMLTIREALCFGD